MKIRYGFALLFVLTTICPTGCGFIAPATYKTVEYQDIHQAASNGDTATLSVLLKSNPHSINTGDYDKNTPLLLAAMHDRTEAVQLLLDNGANINATNTVGATVLHAASRQGFLDVVKVLLSRHANLNIRDSRGWTPLVWAVKSHHLEVANLLRKSGAHE